MGGGGRGGGFSRDINQMRMRYNKFKQHTLRTLQDMLCKTLCFLAPLWPWIKVSVIQTSVKMPSLIPTINMPKHLNANIYFFYTISKYNISFHIKFSHSSDISTCCLNSFNTISNVILISWNTCKKMKATGLVFPWPCDPQPKSRPLELVWNGRGQWCLQPQQVWKRTW